MSFIRGDGRGILSAMLIRPILVATLLALLPHQPSSTGVAESYLTQDEVHRLAELLPAPRDELTDAEAVLIRAVQDDATAEARARAARAEPGDPLWDFARTLGPSFSKDNCSAIERFITRAQEAAGPVTLAVKRAHARPRPAVSGLRSADSYPSGHCVQAALRARLLAELSPARAEELQRQAGEMALNRVIAGKHSPSDAAAGIALGGAIAESILARAASDPSCAAARDLEAARAEWESVK